MSRVFISLGSNLDNPPRQLARACKALASLPNSRLMAVSPLYWSAPVGDADQPEFLNAVAELETALEPRELLLELQRIETLQGRVRDVARRWGPRTLDLDLLLFDHEILRDPDLIVPHPRMAQRAFVLVPLADLAPNVQVPAKGRVRDLLLLVDRSGVRVAEALINPVEAAE